MKSVLFTMNQKIAFFFDKIPIPISQVFYINNNFFAMVNLQPFVPGHVLLCTKKVIHKIQHLSQAEAVSLFMTANQLCRKLQPINGQYQFVIQNGKQAGQTVRHLHLHLIPKKRSTGLERAGDKKRTAEDMAEEAAKYRTLFGQFSYDNVQEKI